MSFNIIRSDIKEIAADAAVTVEGQKISALIHAENIITVSDSELNGEGTITSNPVLKRSVISNIYENCLRQAGEKECESIVFPLISLPDGGIGRRELIDIAVSVFREYLEDNDMKITLVVSDTSTILMGNQLSELDEYIEERLGDEDEIFDSGADFEENEAADEEKAAEKGSPKKKDSIIDRIFGKKSERPRGKRFYEPDYSECSMMRVSAPEEPPKFDAAAAMMGAAPMAAAMSAAPMAAAPVGRSLDEIMSQVKESWQESLLRLIDEKGFTDTEVYKRANVDRKLFSKIRCNSEYQPKKITAIAFALALRLNLDETRDILGRAGYALSPSSRFDLVIQYFIEHEVYDIYTINLALFEHDQPLLGE